MLFETERDALAWYEKQERILTPEFLESIPWQDVKRHPLSAEFVPILRYMRDVERFTNMYYAELAKTPTVKDPAVKQFMDRWDSEETLHGDLLNRFLGEAGFPSSERWIDEAYASIPKSYTRAQFLSPLIARIVGRDFAAVHMAWGAIQEYSTLTGYERLWQKAGHPVLEYLLRAIAREEAMHSFYYWSVARIKLARSGWSRQMAKFMIERFWSPVGEGAKRKEDTDVVIRTLFPGADGVRHMHERVTRRIAQLPGLEKLTRIDTRIAEAALTV